MKHPWSARTLTEVALSAALLVICSLISIPAAVPFTLQTFGVFVILIILGWRKGCAGILLFMLLGLIGLPVFSGGRGGPAALFGPTGGYMLGFLLTGLCYLVYERLGRERLPAQIASLVFGLILCYTFGTLWFVQVYTGEITLSAALAWCVWPFILPDLIKLVLALLVGRRVRKALRNE